MENPYLPPKNTPRRVFKTPLIVPLSVIMVIAIYVGYVIVFFTGEESDVFSRLKSISFEVFILCEIGMISAIIYNKLKLDAFLTKYPAINGKAAIEELKPIVRTNMYSALLTLFFLGLGSLMAIMSILNYGLVKGIIVAVLSILAAIIIKWYNSSEETIKQIECTDNVLGTELEDILECWIHKPLPTF